MRRLFRTNHLIHWYAKNVGKIVLLLIILVFFSISVLYIPYLNVFVTAEIGFGVAFFSWYFIFWPSTASLIAVAMVVLAISAGLASFRLTSLDDGTGSISYALLLAILINYVKEMATRKNDR